MPTLIKILIKVALVILALAGLIVFVMLLHHVAWGLFWR